MRRTAPLLLVAALTLPASRAFAGPEVGKPAPELGKLETISGERLEDLRALRGRVVFLNFFATW